MATPYTEIYTFFLSKIKEYSFLKYTTEELEDALLIYLRTAITKFDNCKTNLSDRDDVSKEFSSNLSDTEMNILADLMLVSFLKQKLATSDKLEMLMSDNDFKIYSQANNLKESRELYSSLSAEAEKSKRTYSFLGLDLSGLKNGKD